MNRLMKLEMPAMARMAVNRHTPRETFFGPTRLRMTRARLSEPTNQTNQKTGSPEGDPVFLLRRGARCQSKACRAASMLLRSASGSMPAGTLMRRSRRSVSGSPLTRRFAPSAIVTVT